MSSNAKICPNCQKINAAMNLVCLACETSLIHETFAPNFTDRYAGEREERPYVLEEILTPTFWVCLPLGVFSGLIACRCLFGGLLNLAPLFLALAMLLAALPFFPGDPVGDLLRRSLEKQLLPAHKPAVPPSSAPNNAKIPLEES